MGKNHDIFNGFTVNLFLDEDGDYLAPPRRTPQCLGVLGYPGRVH